MSEARGPRPAQLMVGDPAPWIRQRSTSNADYALDTAAGRYMVLCFFGSAGHARSRAALEVVRANQALFDDQKLAFFGISVDPRDESEGRVREQLPGLRYFWDFDGRMSRGFGALSPGANGASGVLHLRWLVLDPDMRVRAVIPFRDDLGDHADLLAMLRTLPPVGRHIGFEVQAPVLLIPNVFEPELCDRLIGYCETKGSVESGFMREQDGKTIGVVDHSYKRRTDCEITDADLTRVVQTRIGRRVRPEIQKVHFFDANRMERYIIACYAAEDAAHFRAHRDNTTTGTAHRRYAVSVNLNDDFDGGEVSFPEYGPRGYKAPRGGAVVFSCSLLHAVSQVTRGRRYAFLPFLYDDAAARIREANAGALEEKLQGYRSTPQTSSAA